MEFSILGWQGFEFEAPFDWILMKEKGDLTRGSLDLGDGIHPRLTVEWRPGVVDAVRVIRERVTSLKAKYERFTILREVSHPVSKHQAETCHWQSITGEGFLAMWNCAESGRNFSLNYPFRTEEFWRLLPLINKALGSMKCHSSDRVKFWSIAGLQAAIPSDYQLTKRDFAAEHTYLCFRSPKTSFDIDLYPFPIWRLDKIEKLMKWFQEAVEEELQRRYGAAETVKAKQIEALEDRFMIRRIHGGGLLSRRKYYVESWVWPHVRTGRIYIGTVAIGEDSDGGLQEELSRILASAKPKP